MASATADGLAATVMVSLDVVVPFDVAVPFDALAPAAVVTTAAPAGAPAPAPAGPPRHDVGRLVRGGAVVERGLRIVVIRFAVERRAGVALSLGANAEPTASQKMTITRNRTRASSAPGSTGSPSPAQPSSSITPYGPAAPPRADDARVVLDGRVVPLDRVVGLSGVVEVRREVSPAQMPLPLLLRMLRECWAAGLPGPIAQHWWPGSASFTHPVPGALDCGRF